MKQDYIEAPRPRRGKGDRWPLRLAGMAAAALLLATSLMPGAPDYAFFPVSILEGITPGAVIIMRKAAPFGDPLEINVRGYELSLRKAEAKEITVEVQEGRGHDRTSKIKRR